MLRAGWILGSGQGITVASLAQRYLSLQPVSERVGMLVGVFLPWRAYNVLSRLLTEVEWGLVTNAFIFVV